MFSKLSPLRSGVIALAALCSLPAAAPAAPLGPIGQPAIADSGVKPIPVEMGNGRDCGPGYCGFRRGGWNGRNWNRGWNGRHWNGRYAGDWRRDGWRHNGWRHGWRRGGWGPGLAFGLGLGLPLGYYGGGAPLGYYGGGYDDYYPGYYDRPVYRPRVYYRHRPSNYEYRSYRRGTYNGETGPHCDNAYLNGPNFYRCEGR
jgi:hypothetical protein